MLGILLTIWSVGVLYVIVSLIKPLPPFRTRLRTLGFGTVGLAVSLFWVAVIGGIAGFDGQEKIKTPAVTTSKPVKQSKIKVVEIPTPIRDRAPNLGIVALTHFHQYIKRRVTYKKPRNFRLFKDEFSKRDWSIQAEYVDVICFEDGINAVITAVDGKYYAQNGKAKQFTRFADKDGLLTSTGKVIQLHKTGSPITGPLHKIAVTRSFLFCPQKSLEEISNSVKAALDIDTNSSVNNKPTDDPQAANGTAQYTIQEGDATAQWVYREKESSAFSGELVHLLMTLKRGRMLGVRCVEGESELMYILAEKIEQIDTVNALNPTLIVRVDKNKTHKLSAVAHNNNGKLVLISKASNILIAEIRNAKRRVAIAIDLAGNKFVETKYTARGSTNAANTLLQKCQPSN